MQRIVALAVLIVFVGCFKPMPDPAFASDKVAKSNATSDENQTELSVMTVPPDPLLDQMKLLCSPNDPKWSETVDAFIQNGHPILSHVIHQLESNKKLSSEIATQIYQRIESSPTPALDGQRVLSLMETACYADVTCHWIEHPLRVATLEYIKAHVNSREVKDVLNWIGMSYCSGLPLDAPGDEDGKFRGLLVEDMKIRLKEYARKLLNPPPLSK